MLTPHEKTRLRNLAQKAGIRLPEIPEPKIPLTKSDAKRIEVGLQKYGSRIVVIRKKNKIRIYRLEAFAKAVETGKRLGNRPRAPKLGASE